MMKRLLYYTICSLFLLIPSAIWAQVGPGGVDNTNNILWLDASQLGLSNNAKVSNWPDRSPLGNDAKQTISGKQPIFKTAKLNGLPTIEFDGIDDFLQLDNNITTKDNTTFLVYKRLVGRSPIITTKHHSLTQMGNFLYSYITLTSGTPRVKNLSATYSITSQQLADGLKSLQLRSSTDFSNYTYVRLEDYGSTSLIGTDNTYFLDGEIAEIIVFDKKIKDAQRKIVGEYLGGKYNLTTEAGLYDYQTDYGIDVKGIGKESNGNQITARGNDSLLISNASSLGNGDYIIVGSDGGDYNTTAAVGLGTGVTERWNRVWRVDKTGTPGTVDLTFYLKGNSFALQDDYIVYIENENGDFTDGGTTVYNSSYTFNATAETITFHNVSLNKGDYFTLAEKVKEFESAKSGNWNDPSTWTCNCIPVDSSTATILKGHTVTVHSQANIFDLTVKGTLSFDNTTNDTLSIYNIFRMDGNLNAKKGTIEALKINTTQYFYNNTSKTITFNNLYVNNNLKLSLENGKWAIRNNLQVSSGGLNVKNTATVTLLSTATSTSQILPSISNAFTGDFIVQRYINPRTANFANISSPVENTTIADLDEDLILSGLKNGRSGDAVSRGGIFYSVWYHDSRTNKHVEVTTTTFPLLPTRGFEVWLQTDPINLNTTPPYSFQGGTIDFKGKPNNGDVSVNYFNILAKGWNFIGNPYHSFIDWSIVSVEQAQISNNYYIYNTQNGSYDLVSDNSTPIAPEQGFWVYQSNGGGYHANFTESSKVDSHDPTFKRKKSTPNFSLNLSNDQNPFSHKMEIAFDAFATKGMDEMDAPFLKSPIETAPSITATPANSSEEVVRDVVNPNETSQLIPLNIGAGVNGNYTLRADNLDALYQNYSCVYLQDNETNETIDLSVEPTYEFEAKEGKSNRFNLVLSHSYDECHALLKNGTVNQEIDHNLQLRNSYQDWYLDYTLGEQMQQIEVHIFNMSGQLVKKVQAFEANNSGTYRLNNLQDLHGIYLIQVKSKDGVISKTIKF